MSKKCKRLGKPCDDNGLNVLTTDPNLMMASVQRQVSAGHKAVDQLVERFQVANKLWHRCKWPDCNYTSNRTDTIVRHLRKHTGDRPYRCHLCSYATIQSSALKIHIRRHTGEKPYLCKFADCGKRFTVLGTLLIHERTHTGLKPFRCPLDECEYAANEKSKLTVHIKKTHGLDANQTLKVLNIENSIKTQLFPINFLDHLLTTPENIQIEVDVPVYGSDRSSAETIDNHSIVLNGEHNSIKKVSQYVEKRVVNNKNSYACKWEGCSYDTNRSDSIVRHIHSHTGDKPYKCDKCDYKTVQRSALKQHLVWHTKDKPFKCQLCSYSTIKRHNLDDHLTKNHMTSAPIVFPNVNKDLKHIEKFIEKKRMNWFECKFGNGCTYGTIRKDAIVRHINTHTSIGRSTAANNRVQVCATSTQT